MRHSRNIMLIFCFATASLQAADSRPSIVVELTTGQRLRASGVNLEQSNTTQVCLYVESESSTIHRRVSWNRVRQFKGPKQTIEKLEPPENVSLIPTDDVTEPAPEANTSEKPTRTGNSSKMETEGGIPRLESRHEYEITLPEPVAPVLSNWNGYLECRPLTVGVVVGIRDDQAISSPFAPPVQHQIPSRLEIEAHPTNRLGMVDWDSLNVSMMCWSATGEPCFVRGMLRCTLWGRRQRIVGSYNGGWTEDVGQIAQIGSWSRPFDSTGMQAPGVLSFNFPLTPNVPDHDLSWASQGILTAELDIPGVGRMATTTDPIALRRTDELRVRSLLDSGTQFFPYEATSNSVRPIGLWPKSMTGLWPDRRLFSIQP